MIKLNATDASALKVVVATDAEIENNHFLKATTDSFFIDFGQKTIYLKLNLKAEDRRKELKKVISSLVTKNVAHLSFDLDALIKAYRNDQFSAEQIFNTVVETIAFVSHPGYSDKKVNPEKPDYLYNLTSADDKFNDLFTTALIKTEMTNYARDLQDTPPNLATSEWIAEKITTDAKTIPGVKLTVLGLEEARKLGMGLLLAVNSASEFEPRVVIAEYNGDASKPKTVLVGKGITFDSGGYNLKPSQFMKGMKFDMSGAAVMISTVFALAKAQAKANVAAIGMFTDNRIGGHGTLPESVIKSMNGLTVQIDNTDAEGRLVLADGLTYGVRELKAERLIEASTLTGAISVALGPWATGGFTKSDSLWKEVEAASFKTGETIWRLPIYPEHLEVMKKTPIADLTNSEPGRNAGSSTAAAFLNEFAEGLDYIHLDIASTADDGTRGTGVLVKTLFELLAN